MANSIKETPKLMGKDAKAFYTDLAHKVTHKPTEEEKELGKKQLQRMEQNYKALRSISDGNL